MKDYISKAEFIDFYIDGIYNTEIIKKYKINKKDNDVTIKYMDNWSIKVPLTETIIEEISKKQKEQFEIIRHKTNNQIRTHVALKGTIVGLYLGTIIFVPELNWFVSGCLAVSSTMQALTAYHPLKLKREMNLVSWITDHQLEVNELIKSEVESNMESEETAQMIPVYRYPTLKVPYSEEIYEEGINLSNIDSLSTNELKQIKKKVLRKKRTK